jgi:hypothetical protein
MKFSFPKSELEYHQSFHRVIIRMIYGTFEINGKRENVRLGAPPLKFSLRSSS